MQTDIFTNHALSVECVPTYFFFSQLLEISITFMFGFVNDFLQENHARRAKNGLNSNFGAVTYETGIFVPTNGKPLDITRFQRRRSILTENGIDPTETDSFVRSSKSVWSNPRGFESHPVRQNKVRPSGADFVLVQNEGIRRARE